MFEESDDIGSEMSENDCRQDTVGNTNNVSILTDFGNDINEPTLLSTSVVIENLQESQQNTANDSNTKSLAKSIEIYSAHWQKSGRCYRLCCFSALGLKITICLNTIMILLNSGLIMYEIVLIIRDKSIIHTALPLWYIVCDIIITLILFIEICFTVGAINHCNICEYLQLGWESQMDITVLILSIACCFAYYFDFTEDIDTAVMLCVRVVRDIIRIMRCIWFLKMLYSNLIRLEIRKTAKMSFRGEAFLANKAWNSKYQLQINSSPTSAESDQREYKGPKRVEIYDEEDIERMMQKEDEKLKQRQIYPQTPSPPLSKTTTPHSSIRRKSKQSRPNRVQNGLSSNVLLYQ